MGRAPEAPAPVAQAPKQTLLSARVLLVEDNRINQEICKAMLRKMGCTIDVADNGRAGYEAAFRASYDIVLMDCQMPEMDGFAATVAIRSREVEVNAERAAAGLPARRLPVVALTANAMEGDRERCLTAGMDDYLAKPFKKPELVRVLERWVGRDRRESAAAA
jgi:CheY-like chemotaxis protein